MLPEFSCIQYMHTIMSLLYVQSLNELHVSFKVFVCVCLVDVQCLYVTFYEIVTDAFMIIILDQMNTKKEEICITSIKFSNSSYFFFMNFKLYMQTLKWSVNLHFCLCSVIGNLSHKLNFLADIFEGYIVLLNQHREMACFKENFEGKCWKNVSLMFVLVFLLNLAQQRKGEESEGSERQVSQILVAPFVCFLEFPVTVFSLGWKFLCRRLIPYCWDSCSISLCCNIMVCLQLLIHVDFYLFRTTFLYISLTWNFDLLCQISLRHKGRSGMTLLQCQELFREESWVSKVTDFDTEDK